MEYCAFDIPMSQSEVWVRVTYIYDISVLGCTIDFNLHICNSVIMLVYVRIAM